MDIGRPIAPAEITPPVPEPTPCFVYNVINDIIQRKCTSNGKSVVTIIEFRRGIREYYMRNNLPQVFKQEWFNVESTYRDAGWIVEKSGGSLIFSKPPV